MPEQPTQTQDTVTQAIITCDGAYLPSSARHFCPVRPSVDATLRSFGLLWIVLFPITCLCPCVGCPLELLEKGIKLPVNLVWWVLD